MVEKVCQPRFKRRRRKQGLNAKGQSNEPGAGRSDGARTTGAALEAHYRFMLWLIPTVQRFRRSRKFLLGDRIQSTAFDVLERLIAATYMRRGLTLARARGGSWNNNPRNLRSANRQQEQHIVDETAKPQLARCPARRANVRAIRPEQHSRVLGCLPEIE